MEDTVINNPPPPNKNVNNLGKMKTFLQVDMEICTGIPMNGMGFRDQVLGSQDSGSSLAEQVPAACLHGTADR